MRPRILCIRWTPMDRAAARRGRLIAATLDDGQWKKICDWRGVLLFAHVDSLPQIIVLPAEFGVIVGPLFDRATSEMVTGFSSVDAEALVTTGGQDLFSKYWGPCCALLHNRGYDYLHALRDPAGGAPLYVYEDEELQLFFTQTEDLVSRCDRELACDEDMLRAYLVQPRLLTNRTAMQYTEELLAGERLTMGRDSRRRDLVWRPHASDKFGTADFNGAAQALRASVVASARAWWGLSEARGATSIVHRLSGGLDSSIVLAALCEAGADRSSLVCFNEFPEATPEGDERSLARTVSQKFGVKLIEHQSEVSAFDYARILNAPLPVRPTHTEFSHAAPDLGIAIASLGATIVTSGQGGDQVLHRRRFSGPAADAAIDMVGVGPWLRIAQNTARLGRIPIWEVFADTLAIAHRRGAPLFNPVFAKTVLAANDAVSIASAEWSLHPWASIVAHQPPARAARAMHIADLSYYHEPSVVTRRFTSAPVLASLPVIETVLAIPPYVMTQGGHDRSLARAAFASDLPEEVRARSHKGDTTRFHNRVLERQLPFVRDLLVNGELARRGLVDAERLRAAMSRDVIADGSIKGALMSAFIAEVWLQRFCKHVALRASEKSQRDAVA